MSNLGARSSSEKAIKLAIILGVLLPFLVVLLLYALRTGELSPLASVPFFLLFGVVMDALFCWAARDLFGETFGFPTEYRVGRGDPHYGRSRPWTSFNAEGINGWTNPRISCLPTDDGLAFDVRSSLGFSMMHKVCVRWSALRVKKVSDHITDKNRLKFVVLNTDGSVATTLVPSALTDRRQLASLAQWIAQGGAKESHAR